MQQRPIRFYITQEEDHTVVRSVPMARRARTLLPPEERELTRPDERPTPQPHQSVTDRLRSKLRKGA